MSARSETRTKVLAFAVLLVLGSFVVFLAAQSSLRRAAAAECFPDDGAEQTLSSLLVSTD
jgi:hypothetical protein